MPIEPHRDDTRSDRVGKVGPAQGRSAHASTARGAGVAEHLTLADRVKVERQGGRITVILTRRYNRQFSLSDDEAAYLYGQLGRFVPPVTVTRIEDRP